MSAAVQASLGRKIMISSKVNGITIGGLVDTGSRWALVYSHLVKRAAFMEGKPLTSVLTFVQ